jgi:hypothetical protein
MPEVQELIILHNLHTDQVTVQSELRYLVGAQAVETVNLEPQSGSNTAKYLQLYVWAR